MRILFVSTLYPSSLEPTRATYNRSLLTAMAALGHEVEVIAPIVTVPGMPQLCPGRFPPRWEMLDGIRVSHPPFYRTPRCLIYWHDHFCRWSIARHFCEVVERFEPDHVILGFAFPDAAAMAPLCERLGLRWSVRLNGSDFLFRRTQRGVGPKLMALLRRAPLIVTSGEALAGAVREAGIPAEQLAPFRNGIDPAHFHPVAGGGITREGVLYVGNLLPVKGADRLIAVWNACVTGMSEELVLTIIGGGALEREMRQQVGRAGLEGQVVFLGRRTPREIADCMRRAQCLVLPSRSEGMPNVVVEALACGTPVVASAVGEVPRLVRDGENGFLIDPKSSRFTADLAAALRRALARSWDHTAIAAPLAEQSWEAAARLVLAAIARRREEGAHA